MKKRLGKIIALNLGCLVGGLCGVFFKTAIDTALERTSGFGGEILVLPLIFLLIYMGFYIGRELAPVKQSKEGAK